jgi:hypothetical protein
MHPKRERFLNVQVQSVREPSAEEVKRYMLQQDGCTGDVIFLTCKTVPP